MVTGAGRGIGAAVARELAGEGLSLVLAARSKPEIDALAAEIARAGGEAFAVVCDVTAPENVTALAEAVRQRFGGADVLVNNAGIASAAPLKAQTLEEWERLFAVNVRGVFLCSQAFLPAMIERGWGRIVNVASIAGRTGAAYISAYAATKHAVVGFTRSLAAEVAAKGVTVNAVCPGYVDTPMTDQSVANMVSKTKLSEEEAREKLRAMSPQHRLFTPEEIAFSVRFLCDERAGGINGQTLVIDGGTVLA